MSKGRHAKPTETTTTMKKVALAATVGLGAAAVPATFAGTAHASSSSTVWDRLAECESGQDFANRNAPYYGGFQFLQSTWNAVGGSGNPADATPAEQLKRAKILLAQEGPGQWTCSTMTLQSGQRYAGEYVGLTQANGAAEGLSILGGSSSTTPTTPSPTTPAPSSTSGLAPSAAKAIAWALNTVENEHLTYVWGGEGPTGYDCSGYLQAAWRAAGVEIPRDTYGMNDGLPHVSQSDMRPGDLILLYFPSATGPAPNHVVMYIGDGKIVEMSGSRGNIVGNLEGRGGSITAVVRPAASESPTTSTPPPASNDDDTTPPPSTGGDTHTGGSDTGGSDTGYPEGGKHYTVKPGDYLVKIADEQNVRGGWKALYEANRDEIGSDPNVLSVGQDLILPNPDAYDASGLPEPGHQSPSAVPLQKELKRTGYMPKSVKENANYGPQTQAAVAKFHNDHTEYRWKGVAHDVHIGSKGWAYLLGAPDAVTPDPTPADPAPSTPSEESTQPETPAETPASTGWVAPVSSSVGTPYHQSGGMWSLGYHTGVDFSASTGTPVHAVGPGQVVVAADNAGSYGTHVIIKHEDGKYSLYAHFSSRSVSVGDTVTAGEVIGLSGATGNVTGPHLHFEARTSAEFGSDIDPIAWLASHGVNL